jgi:hypothetical protein
MRREAYGFLHAKQEEGDDVLADDDVQLLHVLPAIRRVRHGVPCVSRGLTLRPRFAREAVPVIVEVFVHAQLAQKRKLTIVTLHEAQVYA